jgi:hypothetical protein
MAQFTRAVRVSLTLAGALALAPLAGHAQSWIKPGEETMLLRVGGLSSRIDSSVRLDGNRGGTGIDLEGDTGLDGNRTTYFLGGTLRVAPKHRFDFLYDENSRSGSRSTQREYVIDDIVIPAGTTLSAGNKTRIGYLGYRYSFLKNPTGEVAAGVGMYGGNFQYKFQSGGAGINIDESTTLPLPVLSLSGDWYLTERMFLRAGVNGLKLTVNDVDGSVLVANVGGEYQITNNFGIGLSFEYFDIEVDAVKGGFKGNASLETSKALIYLTGRF